jgi:hypothetical protein
VGGGGGALGGHEGGSEVAARDVRGADAVQRV